MDAEHPAGGPASDPHGTTAWATPVPVVALLTVGGLALAVAAWSTAEPVGRVFVGLAALAALVTAFLSWRQRPRLAVLPDDAGIAVTRLSGRHEFPRASIDRARIVDYPRLGRRTPMLEIDVDDQGTERLLIFGRWDLGTDPRDVFDVLVLRDLVGTGRAGGSRADDR